MRTVQKSLRHVSLQPTDVMLKTYKGEPLAPEWVKVQVSLNKQTAELPLYVVKVNAPPLLGREWLRAIRLNWKELNAVQLGGKHNLGSVLKWHSTVFSNELDTLKGFKSRVTLKHESMPKFCSTRTVPYALVPKVEAKLTHLTELGVISPVKHTDWATPVVPVSKKDATVKLSGGFKVTINPALCVDRYRIQRIEDSSAGGQHFSEVDLSNAYLQMEVEEESRKTLTIST